MTDGPDRPLSSDEMLEQFRDRVERNDQPRSTEPEPEVPGRDSTPLDRSDMPPARPRQARHRPAPPDRPPPERRAKPRALLAVSIGLGLAIFGLVSALTFIRAG